MLLDKWGAVIKGSLGAISFAATLFTIFRVGPALETGFLPVLDKLEITQVESTGREDLSLVRAEYNKKRDCEYIGVAWHQRLPDGDFERVALVLQREAGDDSSPNRPLGKQKGGPWLVAIPPSLLLSTSMVEIFHRCHPFWTTRTHWYP